MDEGFSEILRFVFQNSGKVLASEAAKDAYGKFKNLVSRRAENKSDVEDAFEKLEQKPDSKARRAFLQEELEDAGADRDQEILQLIRQLAHLLHHEGNPPPNWRESYLSRLYHQAGQLPLTGVEPNPSERERQRIDLAGVYTALLTRRPEEVDRLSPSAPERREDRPPQSALAVLNREKRFVLLGDPGSGKSTFAHYLALCMAGQELGKEEANLESLRRPLPQEERERKEGDEPKPQPWDHGALLPVLVVLRDLAARGLPEEGLKADGDTLWEFIRSELPDTQRSSAEALKQELQENGGLLLLDGLDEVPEADKRREQVKDAVQGFAADFPRLRILVTSRPYAYQKQAWKMTGFAEAVIAPFNRPQMRFFVDNWYRHAAALERLQKSEAQGKARLLYAAIERNPRLEELAERPLLLTLMASLHERGGASLPEQREELYSAAVELLLTVWERGKKRFDRQGRELKPLPSLSEWLRVDRKTIRSLMNRLAFEAHRDQPRAERDTADIARDKLAEELGKISLDQGVNASLIDEHLSQRAGLLLPRGNGVYCFPHRTFQEYLAACHLTDDEFPQKVRRLALADPNRWREVALLAAAKADGGSASAVWSLVDDLCPENRPDERSDAEHCWAALLAAQALHETGRLASVADRDAPKLGRVRIGLRTTLEEGRLAAHDRALAGQCLAHVGDPRQEVIEVDAMHFCWVPGGDFWMGSDSGDEDERPLHRNSHLQNDFWMARYPVTQAQFATFVQEEGYGQKRFWKLAKSRGYWTNDGFKGLLESEPRSAPVSFPAPFALANHPVVGVSWYEAMAFVQWLNERWRRLGRLSEGWELRLPSEAEWEKAARGGLRIAPEPLIGWLDSPERPTTIANPGPQRTYAWRGDAIDSEHANFKETGPSSTSAVGSFPLGESPCGCLDMLGNVWEWTRSIWDDEITYPYKADDGREDLTSDSVRVLRGGAYYSDQTRVRCSCRFRSSPNLWSGFIGFRLALSLSL